MDYLILALIVITFIQIVLIIVKLKKIEHISNLSKINELMGYIDRNDINLTDQDGNNAFILACKGHFHTQKGEFGFEDVVRRGLNNGINVDNPNPISGKTPIMYALNNKENYHITELLLDAGANMNKSDNTGRIPLFDSIKTGRYYSEIVSRTYDINHQDNYGVTPFMIASYEMNYSIIDDLISKNVDGKLKNNSGENAYDIAKNYIDRHIEVLVETSSDDEFGKNNTIVTSKDVLEAQKRNHKVREYVRKIGCYVNGEEYIEKLFKKPFLKKGKAN